MEESELENDKKYNQVHVVMWDRSAFSISCLLDFDRVVSFKSLSRVRKINRNESFPSTSFTLGEFAEMDYQ